MSQLSSQSADISPRANIVCLLLEEMPKLPEQDTKRNSRNLSWWFRMRIPSWITLQAMPGVAVLCY